MKRKLLYITTIGFIIATIILVLVNFLTIKNNKNKNSGNNKNIEEMKKYLFNIESYKANIEVTVISNKNESQYKIEQEVTPYYSKQKVKEPKSIEDMEIVYENGILKIKNTKLNASKIYNNYPYIYDNALFLIDFIKKYKEDKNTKVEENEDAFYITAENKEKKYMNKKILRVNKKTLKPESIDIQNINNQTTVYILYNDIELNI